MSPGVTGVSNSITVTSAAATHFVVSAPSSEPAGAPFVATVTAVDSFGNTATGYIGTVHFTSTDSQGLLPSDSTLTNGVGFFPVELKTAGIQSLVATDKAVPSVAGSTLITINPLSATAFTVNAPSSVTQGNGFTFAVAAVDSFGNAATSYSGTVFFTSTDLAASLPASSTLVNGAGLFTAQLRTTTSTQTISAADTVNVNMNGTSAPITVASATATHFSIIAPSSAVAGNTITYTLTALNQFNSVATAYTGTVVLSSTDAQAAFPFSTPLPGGQGFFTTMFKTAGNQTITADDSGNANINGTSNTITVTTAAMSSFAVTAAPASLTAGGTTNITVTAKDPFNNTVASYNGTVHFTSSDIQATVPFDSTLNNGTGIFMGTILRTSGIQTVTATDISTNFNGTSNGITVTAAATTHFVASAPSPVSAGASLSLTVTAKDQFGNTTPGYTGTVHVTTSDSAGTLPADNTLTAGSGSFTVTLRTAGPQTLTATDTSNGSITATANVSVVAGAATHFTVTANPTSVGAGGAATFTVKVLDSFNNLATNYLGTVGFTLTDPLATAPANYTFVSGDAGVHAFSVTLKTVGNQTLTAKDTGNAAVNGTSNAVTVTAGAATHFAVVAPSTTAAGSLFLFSVTALDQFGNVASSYGGTAHFSSTDTNPATNLPLPATLPSGSSSFAAILTKAGVQTLTAADQSNAGINGSATITVNALGAAKFTVSTPTSIAAGTPFNVTVAAQDLYGNPVPNYLGTVKFATSDPAAVPPVVLPANYHFVGADNGVHIFAGGATLITAGNQSVTATDTTSSSIAGTAAISVTAAAATHFSVVASLASISSGTSDTLTITAQDQFNNTAAGYLGTINFTGTGGASFHPASYTFGPADGGTHVFVNDDTENTVGTQTVTATDSLTSSITGSNTISVTAGTATHFTVIAPAVTTAGNAFNITVTALDGGNFLAVGYTGTVKITTSDGQAVLPPSSVLTNGIGVFTLTLKTAAVQTVTAADSINGSITSGPQNITVVAAGVTHLTLNGIPTSLPTGGAVNFTVTALDRFNNVATNYAGTVKFTTTDIQALPPANYTFVAADAGIHSFSVTLKTAGTQTVTATDAATSSITATSNAITVTSSHDHFVVLVNPSSGLAGSGYAILVTAYDNTTNNYDPSYSGPGHPCPPRTPRPCYRRSRS